MFKALLQYDSKSIVCFSMKNWLVVFICISFNGFAQKEKPQNYRRFDEKLIHFGFMLGGNSTDFVTYQKVKAYENYGLIALTNKSAPGGQLGIVSTMKLGTPVMRLRFIPTLSFQERVMQYRFINPDTTAKTDFLNEERVNSTNLDFPLMLQFRTLRINNFAAYTLIGGQYTLDLQSQQDASQDYIDPFLKIKKHDFQGQIGGGVEFFAPYFKFGMEIKYSRGFNSVFLPENTFIAQPIDRLYNRVWWFSIIFEG